MHGFRGNQTPFTATAVDQYYSPLYLLLPLIIPCSSYVVYYIYALSRCLLNTFFATTLFFIKTRLNLCVVCRSTLLIAQQSKTIVLLNAMLFTY